MQRKPTYSTLNVLNLTAANDTKYSTGVSKRHVTNCSLQHTWINDQRCKLSDNKLTSFCQMIHLSLNCCISTSTLLTSNRYDLTSSTCFLFSFHSAISLSTNSFNTFVASSTSFFSPKSTFKAVPFSSTKLTFSFSNLVSPASFSSAIVWVNLVGQFLRL